MLGPEFTTEGFRFIPANHYINPNNCASNHDLKKLFDLALEEDGFLWRKRAYLKLNWLRKDDEIKIAANQYYFQTKTSNTMDGGKLRQFKVMDFSVLEIPIVQSLIAKNLEMIKYYDSFSQDPILTLGLHFIRYQAHENGASYSSPDWLHKDDEPLVFIHLINLSKTALGGDNLIADGQHKKVTHVFRLENDIDTLVLNTNVYHAVTPLGSRGGMAIRDVILFTVEPNHTQQTS